MISKSHRVPKVARFLMLLASACLLKNKNANVMGNTNRAAILDTAAMTSKGPAVCPTITGFRMTIDVTLQTPIARSKSPRERANGKGMVSQTTDEDGRCNEGDDAQEDRACGGTLCNVHLPCAEVLYRASSPRVLDCDLFEWQKIKAACGGKAKVNVLPLFSEVWSMGHGSCFKSVWTHCGAWTTLQARVDFLRVLCWTTQKRHKEVNAPRTSTYRMILIRYSLCT